MSSERDVRDAISEQARIERELLKKNRGVEKSQEQVESEWRKVQEDMEKREKRKNW